MEEKIQSVQYRDSEPSEFAHKPPKQEMDLSCFPGRLSPIGRSHRLDSVELGVIHIVASSFSVLVAFAHVIEVFVAHHHHAVPVGDTVVPPLTEDGHDELVTGTSC